MKVGMIVPGGVDRSGTHRVIPTLLALIERVAAEHELHVFALTQEPRPATWPLLGATVHNAGGRRPRARALLDIVREHRRGRFDVLHGVWCWPGGVAGVAGKMLGCPVLLHLVGGDVAAVPEADYGQLLTRRGHLRLRATAALASHITANSTYAVDLARKAGVRAERLPTGVSLAAWPPLPPRPRDTSAEARLLWVGNLNRVKDPWTMVRAARALLDAGARFRLDVLGSDTLAGEVPRLAAELGVDDVVRFHGFVPQAELRGWMERADLLLHTSLHECGPIVALEAALAGVPTVGTAVGHLAEWAGEASVAVPMGDAAALAAETAALLADDERRLRLAREAQRRAAAEDADHNAAGVLERYRRLTRSG